MDKKPNFNLNAQGYVPKSNRNDGIEYITEIKHNNYDYGNDKRKNKKVGNNVQQYYDYYTDNQGYGSEYNQNYNKDYNQNYNKDYNQSQRGNYQSNNEGYYGYNQGYHQNSYNQNQEYGSAHEKNYSYSTYGNEYNSNYHVKETKKGKQTNFKDYNQKDLRKNLQPEPIIKTINEKGQKYFVIEKDVSDAKLYQDKEDDYFDNETIDEFECNDDVYEDEIYGEEDNYDEDKYDEIDEMSSNFNKNVSLKKKLVFENNETFTSRVDKMINYSYYTPHDNFLNVLMVAEKPSIAKSISEALSTKFKSRKMGKGVGVFQFDGYFGNVKANFTVSSVMGHVYTSDFQKEHNKWDAIDYIDLYDVPVEKCEANRKTRIPLQLNKLARGKDILCLWLDCDKEGENICYEVIYNIYPFMNKKSYQQIYRAKFSSLTKNDLKLAFNNVKEYPNKNESSSVDARQVIDLKIGVSFTRFLTSAILPGIKNTDLKLLSYGPCQTPTLWFCVNRQNEIDKFRSREYFKVFIEIEFNKGRYIVYYKNKINDKNELNNFMKIIKDEKTTKVVNSLVNKNTKQPPAGLNTVQLLRVASSYLKMSPHSTMVIAERLYTSGYITYPRTETTKYASSFNFQQVLKDYSNHPTFGKNVTNLLKNFKKPILRGVDVGDHPPITPARVANQGDLKGDQWELYEFICNTFFASLAEPAEYEELTYELDVKGNIFECESMRITKEGFLAFMPWKAKNYIKDFPALKQSSDLNILRVSNESHWTQPPDHLSESDLIKLMESNKIGTDASMPVHIENICERGYVKVDSSRRLIPTKLGKALIDSLSNVDSEIVQPTIRSEIEGLVLQIAKGTKRYDEVLKYAIDLYKKKFLVIRQNYDKLLNSFKKYFEIDCMAMSQVYKSIRNKNEALKIQSQVRKNISQITTDLITCDLCRKGKQYVEYDEFDRYILLCSDCKLRKKIIRDAVKIDVKKSLQCQKCSSYYIEVEVENPFLNGDTNYTGCLFCDPNLKS